jgi:hypothetical protein
MWFRKRKDDTTAWITPYVVMYSSSGEVQPEVKAIVKRISEKLRQYQGAIIERNNFKFPSMAILAQVSASYSVADNSISLLAHGGGMFDWSGSLDEFLGNTPHTLIKEAKQHD